MAAEVNIKGSSIEIGQVSPLGVFADNSRGIVYNVSADGQKILVPAQPERKASPPLTLVQNWTAGLKK